MRRSAPAENPDFRKFLSPRKVPAEQSLLNGEVYGADDPCVAGGVHGVFVGKSFEHLTECAGGELVAAAK